MKQYICIDIGGTSIKYGVVDESLNILVKKQMDTESSKGGPGIIEKIKQIICEYQSTYDLSGVAISTAGMVDPEKGEIIYSCDLIPNYTGVALKKIVEDTCKLFCTVENDVNCAGLAESINGAGKGKESCLCLTVGTGIGGCLTTKGRIYHGFKNSACEVGYLRMRGGKSFQELASTSALVKKVAKLRSVSEHTMNGKIIFEAAKAGKEDCVKAIDELIEALSEGIADCVYILNPEIVILGGGITAQQAYLGPRIEAALDEKIIQTVRKSTSFAFAKNGNDAGMIGALINHLQKIEKKEVINP